VPRDQQIDRRVFEEIDRVGEQRHRTDRSRDSELDPEIAEIERRNDEHRAAYRAISFDG